VADLRVELLAIEDCPHLGQAQHDLESVLRKGIIETPVQLIFVGSLEDAEFLAFPGSTARTLSPSPTCRSRSAAEPIATGKVEGWAPHRSSRYSPPSISTAEAAWKPSSARRPAW
jgi:hypothetical protein